MEATISQVKKILFAAFEQEFEAMSNRITALQNENETLRTENILLTDTKKNAITEFNARDAKYQKLENAHEKMRIKYDELLRCVAQFNSQMSHFGILPIAGTPVPSMEPAANVYDAGDSDEMVEDDDNDDADDSGESDDGQDFKPGGIVDLLTNTQELVKHEPLATCAPFAANEQTKDSNLSTQNEQTVPSNRSDDDAGNSTPYPCLYPNCKLKYSALWALNRHIETHSRNNERSQPQRKWY